MLMLVVGSCRSVVAVHVWYSLMLLCGTGSCAVQVAVHPRLF
jgi:hypothetical protein